MLDILYRSVARAGGIEVPGNVRIVPKSPARPSLLKRAADAFERWNVRRSTYLTLKQLDDRLLRDIGLHRGMLHDAADVMSLPVHANDNAPPLALAALAAPLAVSALVANDNERPSSADCA